MTATQANNRRDSAGTEPPVVLTIAFPYAPIGPKATGGAEVVCTQLEASLRSLGFGSVVVAHSASDPKGQLYGTRVSPGLITDELRAEAEAAQQANIDRALAHHPVALVHMHGLDFVQYRLPPHLPVIVTLHLPPSWYLATIWNLPPNYHFICVSETQRRACPAHAWGRLSVIGNGVEIPDTRLGRAKGRYALMLARICAEKNLHAGLDAARLAGLPAVLAGEVYPYKEHQRYFAQEIEPRLTARSASHESRTAASPGQPTARFLGPVGGAEKGRLLARAACLLLPSLAPETSSLVAMEALAAGTPVIAMAVGAVPEIVDHERTGFLIDPGEGAVVAMAAAIARLPEIDHNLCRATAAERFPLGRMLSGYLALYNRLALRSVPAPTEAEPPPTQAEVAPRHASHHDLIAEMVTTTQSLDQLIPAWTALWRRDPYATPFQHPAWLVPWWHQFGPDGDLHTAVLRERATGDLAGLAPLYIYSGGASGERRLLFLGAGTTDYLDGVWVPETQAARTCLTHLRSGPQPWERAHLHQLRATSPLREAALRAGVAVHATEPCSTIDAAGELPPRIRANTARYRRRAAARGVVNSRYAAHPDEALASFDILVSLHRARWEARGEPGVLSDPRVLAHHRESLPLLLEAGLLRLFHLTVSGETMGVLYALADQPHAAERRLYLYLIGFDPRFADCSPGTLLVHAAWDHARENRFVKLDLLRGGEAYKQLWGAQAEPTFGIELD